MIGPRSVGCLLGTTVLLLGGAGLASPALATQSDPVVVALGSPTAPGSTQVTFTFGLARAETGAEQAWRSVSDPTSGAYRHFLSRDEIKSAYGGSPASIAELIRVAGAHSLSVAVDPTGVFAQVTGTARNWTRWLGRRVISQALKSSDVGGGGTAVAYTLASDRVPSSLRGVVSEFYPVDLHTQYPSAQLSGVGAGGIQPPSDHKYPSYNLGTPASCVPAVLSGWMYSYNQVNSAYGISQLPNATTTTPRVAILAQGDGFTPAGVQTSARCFGASPVAVNVTSVEGLSGPLPVGLEGELDIQTVQAALPANSTVQVIQSPIFDPRDYLPWAAAFALPELPDAITTSYGICEPDLDKPATSLAQSVLLRLALAGVSAFAAAGDSGSSGCWDHDTESGPKKLALQFPASSPYVTAVGGSRLVLDAANARTDEVVWDDASLQAPPLAPAKLAGGGGASSVFAQPWYQQPANTGTTMRAVPDLTAHASMVPGWPVIEGNLLSPVAGTSAAAPFLAAGFARLSALQRDAGSPGLGNVSGLLYYQAATQPGTLFDIVSGTNDLFHRGCCTAHPGYDQASGLGAPNLASIYAGLPAVGGSQ